MLDVYFTVFPWGAITLFGAAYGNNLVRNSPLNLTLGLAALASFFFFRTLCGSYGTLREFGYESLYHYSRPGEIPPEPRVPRLDALGEFLRALVFRAGIRRE